MCYSKLLGNVYFRSVKKNIEFQTLHFLYWNETKVLNLTLFSPTEDYKTNYSLHLPFQINKTNLYHTVDWVKSVILDFFLYSL